MISGVISRLAILAFGTLYPAYASFKAVRAKNVTEYVKWMMYWIVFAIFSCIETFTDIFLPWLPFYYEIKVVLVLWLLSPATNGSSILYRNFVHPLLKRKEPEIDGYIVRMRDQGCATALQLSTRFFNYVRAFVMDALHKSFTSNILTLHGNTVRPTASNGNVQEKHYDEWVPRSQLLQTITTPNIFITEESGGEELHVMDVKQELTDNEEPANISGTRPKTTTIKGRRGKASNKNVYFQRCLARKAKKASNDLVTDEDE